MRRILGALAVELVEIAPLAMFAWAVARRLGRAERQAEDAYQEAEAAHQRITRTSFDQRVLGARVSALEASAAANQDLEDEDPCPEARETAEKVYETLAAAKPGQKLRVQVVDLGVLAALARRGS